MAIRAGRDRADFFFPKLPFDDLDVDFFDPGVASRARPGNIPSRDRGSRIRVGKDEMVPVTVVTGGGDGQAPLEQAFPVDALGIIAKDFPLGNIVDTGDRRPFTMARSAEERNVHLVGLRADI